MSLSLRCSFPFDRDTVGGSIGGKEGLGGGTNGRMVSHRRLSASLIIGEGR